MTTQKARYVYAYGDSPSTVNCRAETGNKATAIRITRHGVQQGTPQAWGYVALLTPDSDGIIARWIDRKRVTA